MTHDDSEEVAPEVEEEDRPKRRKKKGRKKKEASLAAPDPVGASMADRMDAWKSADSLLNKETRKAEDGELKDFARKWVTADGEEEIIIGPHDILILATWLLYGAITDEE